MINHIIREAERIVRALRPQATSPAPQHAKPRRDEKSNSTASDQSSIEELTRWKYSDFQAVMQGHSQFGFLPKTYPDRISLTPLHPVLARLQHLASTLTYEVARVGTFNTASNHLTIGKRQNGSSSCVVSFAYATATEKPIIYLHTHPAIHGPQRFIEHFSDQDCISFLDDRLSLASVVVTPKSAIMMLRTADTSSTFQEGQSAGTVRSLYAEASQLAGSRSYDIGRIGTKLVCAHFKLNLFLLNIDSEHATAKKVLLGPALSHR